MSKSSRYMVMRMMKKLRRKAMTGFKTLVKMRGLHFRPKGRTIHCRSFPSQWNRRNLRNLGEMGTCKKASFKSIPTQYAPGFNQSRRCAIVSILNLYFLIDLLNFFRFKIGRNFPGDLALGTAKYVLIY